MSSPQTAVVGNSSPRVVKLEGLDQSPLLVMFGELTARGLGDYVVLSNFSTTDKGTSSTKLPDERTASCLADIMDEIRAEINKTNAELSSLGMARSTKATRQAYLVEVAQSFQNLIRCAVDGTWGGQHRAFFRDSATDQGNHTRLREVIQILNRQFMDLMISRGCQWQVQDEQPLSPASDSKVSEDEEVDTPISSTETVTDGYPHFDSFHIPDQLSKEALLEKIFIVCQSDQDSEFNTYHTVWDLFRDQSSRWSVLAENHVETIRNAICTFLEVALEALTDSSSYNAILVDVVNPAMDKAEADALHILGQILAPSGQVAPSWFKSKLIRSIEQNELQKKVEDVSQAMRQLSNNHESADFDKKILSKVLLMTNEADHQPDFGSISLDDIICYLEIFYQDQLAAFVDNVTSMVIETSLIANLVNIFPAASIPAIDDSSLERLAAESSASQSRRTGLGQKLGCLKDSLAICETNLIHVPRAKSRRSRNRTAQQKRIATTGLPKSSEDTGTTTPKADHGAEGGEVSDSTISLQTPTLTALMARFGPSIPRTHSQPISGPSSQVSMEFPVPKSSFVAPLVIDASQSSDVICTDGDHLLNSPSTTPFTTPVAIRPFTDPPQTDKEKVVGFEGRRGFLTPTEEMKSASSLAFGRTTPLTESPLSKRMNQASRQAAYFVKRNCHVFGEALGANASGLGSSAFDARISVFAKTPDRYIFPEKSVTALSNRDGMGSPTPGRHPPPLITEGRASVFAKAPESYTFDENSMATTSNKGELGSPIPSSHPTFSITSFVPTARPRGDVIPVKSSHKQNAGLSCIENSGSNTKSSSVPAKIRTGVFDNPKTFNNTTAFSSPPKQDTDLVSKDKNIQTHLSTVAYNTPESNRFNFTLASADAEPAPRASNLSGSATTSNNMTPTQKSEKSGGGVFSFYSKMNDSPMPVTSSRDPATGPFASFSRVGNVLSPSSNTGDLSPNSYIT